MITNNTYLSLIKNIPAQSTWSTVSTTTDYGKMIVADKSHSFMELSGFAPLIQSAICNYEANCQSKEITDHKYCIRNRIPIPANYHLALANDSPLYMMVYFQYASAVDILELLENPEICFPDGIFDVLPADIVLQLDIKYWEDVLSLSDRIVDGECFNTILHKLRGD